MSAAVLTAVYPGREPPPTRCADCATVLTDALVLTCGHDLCLVCAGSALRNTRSLHGRTVECAICRERTQICEEAASTLAQQQVQPKVMMNETTFNMLDRNNDGQISREEWNAHAAMPRSAMGSTTVDSPGRGGSSPSRGGHFSPRLSSPQTPSLTEMAQAPSPRTPQRNPSRGALSTQEVARSHQGAAKDGACSSDDRFTEQPSPWHGRLTHIPRCPYHPEEQAEYFCATCECFCICAECVVQKSGLHHGHEVMRVNPAHDKLRARAGVLLDEAVRLEDEFAVVVDRLTWRRKDIERAAARGRASVRSAFERVRAQLNDRESELLESLDVYERDSFGKLDEGNGEFVTRLEELRRLQENLRTRCRNGNDAVEALNTYAAAKKTIAGLSKALQQYEDPGSHSSDTVPEEFINLAGGARAEFDSHAEGLASLERAVRGLCRGVEFQADWLR